MNKTKFAKQAARGMVDYLAKKNAQDSLPLVLRYLKEEVEMKVVKVYSPKNLSKSEQKGILRLVKKVVGETVSKLNFQKDESLIDGIRILYKDKLWDFTLSARINELVGKNT